MTNLNKQAQIWVKPIIDALIKHQSISGIGIFNNYNVDFVLSIKKRRKHK